MKQNDFLGLQTVRGSAWRTAAAAVVLGLGFTLAGWVPEAQGWGGAQHVQINRAAGGAVPVEMKGWRAFSRPMAFPGIYPDLWKGYDADENPRHYFEPDRLPRGFDFSTLNPTQKVAFATLPVTEVELGLAPWMIADVTERMSAAMRDGDWMLAARCGATLGHYVGDLHMPLHCTKNFNGQESRQHGVHTRVESDMVKAFFQSSALKPARGNYVEEPFHDAVGWALESAALVPAILRADLVAKRAADGRTDSEVYYLKLWEQTEETLVRRLNESATRLASLWYTAWVDAGRPEIPPALNELPPYSIFSGVGIDAPETDGTPLSEARQKSKYDLIVWCVMGAAALFIIVSSILRTARGRK